MWKLCVIYRFFGSNQLILLTDCVGVLEYCVEIDNILLAQYRIHVTPMWFEIQLLHTKVLKCSMTMSNTWCLFETWTSLHFGSIWDYSRFFFSFLCCVLFASVLCLVSKISSVSGLSIFLLILSLTFPYDFTYGYFC
jgi:hypothetical protein